MLSLFLLFALQSASAPTVTPDRLAGMDFSESDWVLADGHDRAAITVNAVVDGKKRTLQLDTCADISQLGEVSGPRVDGRSAKIGSTELGPLRFARQSADGSILGLDVPIGEIVAIDCPRSRTT